LIIVSGWVVEDRDRVLVIPAFQHRRELWQPFGQVQFEATSMRVLHLGHKTCATAAAVTVIAGPPDCALESPDGPDAHFRLAPAGPPPAEYLGVRGAVRNATGTRLPVRGCNCGTLTERLTERCDLVTATDVAVAALRGADRRLRAAGRRDQVNLLQRSLDQPWPTGGFDLIVLSEVGYYLRADTLRAVMDRERPRLADGATIVAAHWRHPVDDYPISGDHANEIIGATPGLHLAGSYRDPDVAIDVFDTASATSVAAGDG
jgi:hypothetical protein